MLVTQYGSLSVCVTCFTRFYQFIRFGSVQYYNLLLQKCMAPPQKRERNCPKCARYTTHIGLTSKQLLNAVIHHFDEVHRQGRSSSRLGGLSHSPVIL